MLFFQTLKNFNLGGGNYRTDAIFSDFLIFRCLWENLASLVLPRQILQLFWIFKIVSEVLKIFKNIKDLPREYLDHLENLEN